VFRKFIPSSIRAIDGPKTFTATNFIVVMAPLALVNLYSQGALNGTNSFKTALTLFLATLVAGLVYFSLSLVLRKVTANRLVAIILAFGAAGMGRGAVILMSAPISPENLFSEAVFRLGAGFSSSIVLLGGAAYFANTANHFRLEFSRLLERRESLELFISNSEELIADERRKIAAEVEDKVAQAISELSVAVNDATIPEAQQKLVAKLLDISTSVIRPLSHSLRGVDQQREWSFSTNLNTRVSFKSVADVSVRAAQTNSSLVVFAWGVNGVATITGLRLGPPGYLALIIYVFLMALFLLGASKILERASQLFSQRVQVALITSLYTLVGLVPGLLSSIVLAGIGTPEATFLIRSLCFGNVIVTLAFLWGIRLSNALAIRRSQILSELDLVNRDLAIELAGMRSKLRLKRLSLARILHGDYQSTFIALAADLQNSINRGTANEYRFDRMDQLLQALRLDGSYLLSAPSALSGLEDLRSLWSGAIELETSISSDAQKRLDGSPSGRACFFEVISELVTNTVKHSSATVLSVTATAAKSGLVSVSVRDNGGSRKSKFSAGSGLNMLDETCLNTEYRFGAKGFEIDFDIAI
jgi:signal transduction histidine kinase